MLLAWVLGVALAGDANRGETLAGLGGCAACHSVEDGPAYGGGHVLETSYGAFYGTNLTPDPEHGIGSWSEQDFVRAMRKGRNPSGKRYYPAFPFEWFARISDQDLSDLWAFLQTVEPVATPSPEHELRGWVRGRWKQRFWRLVAMDRRDFRPDPLADAAVNRGGYLAWSVGHCGGCHTPRSGMGRLKRRFDHAGNKVKPGAGPNLTPAGLEGWSRSDLVTFLEEGMTPEGDFAGGSMGHVIYDGTAKLSDADREALVDWILALEPNTAP